MAQLQPNDMNNMVWPPNFQVPIPNGNDGTFGPATSKSQKRCARRAAQVRELRLDIKKTANSSGMRVVPNETASVRRGSPMCSLPERRIVLFVLDKKVSSVGMDKLLRMQLTD